MSTISIDRVDSDRIDDHLPDLAGLLHACVLAGASVSFVLPYERGDSLTFWTESVRPAVMNGRRALLVAHANGHLAGSVQLDCDTPPNQPHRGEVTKLLVHPDARRQGVARALMLALEDEASTRGRRLLTLDTASAVAEHLYLSLGYQRAGAIPGYARDPIEDRYDATVIMYKTL